jgi:hypothetical protein
MCVGTVTGWDLEVTWRTVEVGPSVSDNVCDLMRRCGGYHSRDIRNIKIPNAMNAARRVSIFL